MSDLERRLDRAEDTIIRQEEALKNIQTGMAEASAKRNVMYEKLNSLTEKLGAHMSWEESRGKIVEGVLGVVVIIVISLSAWAFNSINKNENAAIEFNKDIRTLVREVTKVNSTLTEHFQDHKETNKEFLKIAREGKGTINH